MDLVSNCKNKLASFRIKELKDVLTQLGKGKQGRKQDLMDRILDSLVDGQVSRPGWAKTISREEITKMIDDIYRKMYPGATELATKSHSSSNLRLENPKEEVVTDTSLLESVVHCPCGSSLMSDSMIKCEDPQCRVWQHVACVIIPEKTVEGLPPERPSGFHCELCRINKSDPFWLTVKHLLPPVILTSSGTASDGTNTKQNVERTFSLPRADQEMLRGNEYDLQMWCLLLNDKVAFRMQWPQCAELQVNGVPVWAINRPGSQLLGINGRVDGPIVSLRYDTKLQYLMFLGCLQSINPSKPMSSSVGPLILVMVFKLMQLSSKLGNSDQISTCCCEGFNKICLSSCDARIFCFGIRIAKRRTLEQVLNLVPKQEDGERFENALGRVRRCIGGGTSTENAESDSDLEVVADSVTVNLRCPMSGSRIRVAGRFKPCIHMGCFDLEAFVELNQRSLKWQCPICLQNYSLEKIIIDPYFNRITSMLKNCREDVNEVEVKPDGCWRARNEVKFLDLCQWHNPDGTLVTTNTEVTTDTAISKEIKPENSSEGHRGLKLGIKRNRDGRWKVKRPDDARPSSGNHLRNKLENPGQNTKPQSRSATGNHRDGEDGSVNQEVGTDFNFSPNNDLELDSLPLHCAPTYKNNADNGNSKDSDIIVLSDTEENVTIISPGTANETSRVEHLLNNSGDDFSIPLWQMQTGTDFQLFGSDSLADAQDPFASAPTNGYNLASDGGLGDISGSLVDNPLAYGGEDPSLQIFLPNPMQTDMMASGEMPNGVRSNDWVSLTLAGGRMDPAAVNGLNPGPHDSVLFPVMDKEKVNRATSNGLKSDNSPLHAQQPHPAKPQFILSIDSDSE